MGRIEGRSPVLDSPRRADSTRRQSAHETIHLLAVADRGDPGRVPRRDLLGRGFHATEGHVRPGEVGIHPNVRLFTWRNTKEQLTRYITELTQTDVSEYFRNFWTNTPDILSEYLQYGGRAAFLARLVLAATLSGNYGIYGPAFELMEDRAREPGSEEYLDSEKYQVRQWDLESPASCQDVIRHVDRIRRENSALQGGGRLQFHQVDNDQLLCYRARARTSKTRFSSW